MLYALWQRWDGDQRRQDYRAGMIASIIANVNRDPKQRPEPWSPEDFMPQRYEAPKQLTPEGTLDFIASLNLALGGADLRSVA